VRSNERDLRVFENGGVIMLKINSSSKVQVVESSMIFYFYSYDIPVQLCPWPIRQYFSLPPSSTAASHNWNWVPPICTCSRNFKVNIGCRSVLPRWFHRVIHAYSIFVNSAKFPLLLLWPRRSESRTNHALKAVNKFPHCEKRTISVIRGRY